MIFTCARRASRSRKRSTSRSSLAFCAARSSTCSDSRAKELSSSLSFFLRSMSSRWCSMTCGGAAAFSVSMRSSCALSLAKFTTFSWARNWQTLFTWMLSLAICLATSVLVALLLFRRQSLVLSVLSVRLMVRFLPPLMALASSSSTKPLSVPSLMNSLVSFALPSTVVGPFRPSAIAHTMELLPVPLGPRMTLSSGPGSKWASV
mmetsp:Transcript_15950/g.62316  ORF Transcript_15950/g.62316 Transcript_15950/m.62316 type:complete len:205 (+) Transcript_15950:2796-3410(+)